MPNNFRLLSRICGSERPGVGAVESAGLVPSPWKTGFSTDPTAPATGFGPTIGTSTKTSARAQEHKVPTFGYLQRNTPQSYPQILPRRPILTSPVGVLAAERVVDEFDVAAGDSEQPRELGMLPAKPPREAVEMGDRAERKARRHAR